jgi:uncharacterized protein YdeI (YjbR/CyaY-like superfamily)
VLDCDLVEEIKWGKPCFTYRKKNVGIVAPDLRAPFEALTPGRRKSYIFHVSGAKQAKTRAARAERCVPMILSGRGFNELRD